MSKFFSLIDQISNSLIPENQDPVVTDRNLYPLFKKALNMWIEVLPINIQEQQALRGISHEKYDLPRILFFLWKPEDKTPIPFIGSGSNNVYDYAQHFLRWRNTDTKIITLIAFVIVAFCYCIYLINSSQQSSEVVNNDQPQAPKNLLTSSLSLDHRNQIPSTTPVEKFDENRLNKSEKLQVLLLAISAQKDDFIKALKLKRKIDYQDSGMLYESCEYLLTWDNKTDVEFEWNRIKNNLKSSEFSEHDIYLVQVRLPHFDTRFKENINQLDRYDAFRELTGLEIELSPRLRVTVYNEFDFYKR